MQRDRTGWYDLTIVVAVAFAIAVTSGRSAAQGTARSMDIDISARSAALGGASTALPWGDLNHWANPAVLGYAEGIRFTHGRTQLVPEQAPNVYFTTDYVQVGAGGLGLLFSGKPLDHGGVHLDYGGSEGRDENGNFTGTFDSYERVHSWGSGASAARLLGNALGAFGAEVPDVSRYADVSFGYADKHTEIVLAPASAAGTGHADSQDWGWLARLTPYDGLEAGEVPVRLDATYGRSDINYHLDHLVVFINEDQASPVTRQHRRGATVRGSVGRVPGAYAGAGTWWMLLRGLTPLVSLMYSGDHVDVGTLDRIDYKTDGHGMELTIANVYSWRRGHYTDRTGQIDGDTWGYGVSLPIGRFAGAAYDEAHFPQAMNSGLGMLHRKQFSAWIDPFAIWRATHAASRPGTY